MPVEPIGLWLKPEGIDKVSRVVEGITIEISAPSEPLAIAVIDYNRYARKRQLHSGRALCLKLCPSR
jgi:hypothetical protein